MYPTFLGEKGSYCRYVNSLCDIRSQRFKKCIEIEEFPDFLTRILSQNIIFSWWLLIGRCPSCLPAVVLLVQPSPDPRTASLCRVLVLIFQKLCFVSTFSWLSFLGLVRILSLETSVFFLLHLICFAWETRLNLWESGLLVELTYRYVFEETDPQGGEITGTLMW